MVFFFPCRAHCNLMSSEEGTQQEGDDRDDANLHVNGGELTAVTRTKTDIDEESARSRRVQEAVAISMFN